MPCCDRSVRSFADYQADYQIASGMEISNIVANEPKHA